MKTPSTAAAAAEAVFSLPLFNRLLNLARSRMLAEQQQQLEDTCFNHHHHRRRRRQTVDKTVVNADQVCTLAHSSNCSRTDLTCSLTQFGFSLFSGAAQHDGVCSVTTKPLTRTFFNILNILLTQLLILPSRVSTCEKKFNFNSTFADLHIFYS